MFKLKQTYDFVAAVLGGDVATSLEIMFRFGRERATAAIKGEYQAIAGVRETFVENFHLYTDQFRELGASERHIGELKRALCDGFDDTISQRP